MNHLSNMSDAHDRLARVAFAMWMVMVCGLFGWASYPTLEAWTFWVEWRQHGFNYYFSHLDQVADRPLHWFPSLVAWLLPGPFDLGSCAVGLTLAISRWTLAAAIARAFDFTNGANALFVFSCVGLPAWAFSGFDRFQPAQLSFSFLLLSWYCLGRHMAKPQFFWLIAACISLECCLFSYQALLFVILAFPLMAMLIPGPLRCQSAKVLIVFWLAVACYLAFRSVMLRLFPTAYTTVGTTSAFKPEYLMLVYKTVWLAGPFSWLPLVALAIAIVPLARRNHWKKTLILSAVAFASAPLCGLVYFSARNWLMDPDRVMFPVQVWMIAALVPFAACPEKGGLPDCEKVVWRCLTIMGVAWVKMAIVMAYCVWIQIAFYGAMKSNFFGGDPDRRVRLEDHTGICGNFYTAWYFIVDRSARIQGIPGKFTLCRGFVPAKHKAPGPSVPSANPPTCQKCQGSGEEVFRVEPGLQLAGYPLTVRILQGQGN